MKKVFFIVGIILVVLFVVGKINDVYTDDIQTEKNEQDNKKDTSILSEDEKERGIDELKDRLDGVTDNIVLSVNGEEISEREIAFMDYLLNNSVAMDYKKNYGINQSEEKKDPVDEIIREYVICQEAQKNNISLTAVEIEEMSDKVENDKDIDNLLKRLNMTYDEFREMYVNQTIRMEIKRKWTMDIVKKINNKEISIDSELFNNKYKEYYESNELSIKQQLLLELIEIYEEYLVNQANVKEIG